MLNSGKKIKVISKGLKMQTLCLDKLQYILMQQMPAQLRDVFLGVGSHSENIWFSDQKQPLKHLP